MSLDVRPDHLKIVRDILSAHVPDREVWAFGSRVTGKATETSDLDLAIIGDTPLDFETLATLRDAFSESRIPYKVDVVDWTTTSESFRKIVLNEKLVVLKGEKRSGVRSDWYETTLGEVLTLQRGFDLPETERQGGSYPVVASTGYVGSHSYAMVKGPGVVIGRSGSIGGGQYIKCDFWPLNTTLWVKDFKGNDKRFCYYLIKSLDLSHFNVGSGVPTLNRNHVHPLPIVVPRDTSEQRAIAHILGTLDDKIELNRRMNETLEAMARAIFKSWFVDFDPVRAKMEGRETGLPKEIEDLFPDSFEDSELGEIPRGWKPTTVGEAFELNPTEKLQKGKASPYLDMAAIPTVGSYPDFPTMRSFLLDQNFGMVTPFLLGLRHAWRMEKQPLFNFCHKMKLLGGPQNLL